MAFPRRIEITEAGKKSLRKMPPAIRIRLLKKLQEYNDKPELMAANIKQLTDVNPPMSRLRIGDYRAVGTISGDRLLLHVFIDRKDL
jgi:mRNA-degrading endonuclease RelE of RelBE toxin-antitoxin system